MTDLQKAMTEVNDLNRSHGVTQRGGKKYTEVFVRVEAFRKAFGTDYGVDTQILVDDGKRVVVKAVITNATGMIIGSGMAEEIRGVGNVNKTSALENGETSAIGRALASLGLHGGTYASINEIDAVPRKKQAQKEQASGPSTKATPAPETVALLSHTGNQLKELDHSEFAESLVKMFKVYCTTTHDKAGNEVEPRRRMTLLRELKEHNESSMALISEALNEQIMKAYTKNLRSLGAQNGEK